MANDPRLQATLEYTTDDDGIWLVYEQAASTQRVNLGFWPSVADVISAAASLHDAVVAP